MIYADCVGAGYDRKFTYTTETVSYINQLPISTDASGAVYNGVGYKANTYLSSGNDGTKNGIYATGFIPCKLGDTLYCKNVGMQTGQDAHRLSFYDSSKTYLAIVKTTTTAYTGWNYGEDGNISSIGIRASGNNQNTAFVRFCCGYLGDDSIITVNEPIE